MYISLYSAEQESKKALSALVATTVLSTPDRSVTSSKQHLQGEFSWHWYMSFSVGVPDMQCCLQALKKLTAWCSPHLSKRKPLNQHGNSSFLLILCWFMQKLVKWCTRISTSAKSQRFWLFYCKLTKRMTFLLFTCSCCWCLLFLFLCIAEPHDDERKKEKEVQVIDLTLDSDSESDRNDDDNDNSDEYSEERDLNTPR